jgi:hypothetical protein|tara:strand:+ start:664 stop:876 length:213 start_codon:yes stop_codon:yes gene_type:complete
MNKKQKIDSDDLMKDTNKILKIINNLETMNLENIDIKKLEEEINTVEKDLRKKYKNILPENLEDYLDTPE